MSFKVLLTALDGCQASIELKDNEKVTLGRNRLSGIRDTGVSRKHVELTLDLAKDAVVIVRFVGRHAGQLNGKEMARDEMLEMANGDTLSLLMNKYKYKLSIESTLAAGKGTKRIRKEEEEDYERGSKRLRNENNHSKEERDRRVDSSDDEAEHARSVEEKLLKLKQSFGMTQNASAVGAVDENNKKIGERNAVEKSTWHEENRLLIYHCKGLLPSDKIASFDMDGTLITTQSGKVFPTSTSDWKFLLPEVPGRLKELNKNGYKIVIFSNQMGLAKGKVDIGEFKQKVERIIQKIGVPVQAFVASGPGLYRKPCSGMWDRLEREENDGVVVNKGQSFYVGDAAGRPKDWQPGAKKDFSCSDRLFSINVGLRFETPEEFFLNRAPSRHEMPSFDPRSIDVDAPILNDPNSKLVSDKQEVIVLVGYPAAGKSHFVRSHLEPAGYHHINRDTLGSWQKCVQKSQEMLKAGKSVVVDNTNPDKESRKRFISAAREFGVDCRCFVLATSLDHSRHNEKFREMTDRQHQTINDMIFNTYKSKYQEPTLSEGFDEIVEVNFLPRFLNDQDKTLYRQFLLEK